MTKPDPISEYLRFVGEVLSAIGSALWELLCWAWSSLVRFIRPRRS